MLDVLLTAVCLGAGVLLIIGSAPVKEGIAKGLKISAQALIPSLFPFMVLSSFFAGSGAYLSLSNPLGFLPRALFRLPSYTAGIILLSLVGGYPAGAKMIRSLLEQKRLNETQAQSMLCFCFGSGPAFAITVVGIGVFGSAQAGIILFASHLIASFITGMLFARRTPVAEYTGQSEVEKPSAVSAFVDSVNGSVSAMLSICAFVMLFCGVLSFLQSIHCFDALDALLPDVLGGEAFSKVFTGLMEVTGGCLSLNPSGQGSLLLAAFFLSFGGFCVHAQVYGILHGYTLSYFRFLLSRLCCGSFSVLITYLSLRFFPLTLSTSSQAGSPVTSAFSVSPLSALFLFFLVWSFVCRIDQKWKTLNRQ